MASLLQFYLPNIGRRVGYQVDGEVYDITEQVGSFSDWIKSNVGRVRESIVELDNLVSQNRFKINFSDLDVIPDPQRPHLLAPIDTQDVWGAGVTYVRSREARKEESIDGGDIYARVYAAKRPEVFFKAPVRNVVGHRDWVGIRHDATWSVPEPEFTILLNPAMEVVGITIGNDMCSRDIEGENPLYLPQGKIYTASCALGPRIVLQAITDWPEIEISLEIYRDGSNVFSDNTNTASLHRKLSTLVEYLQRCNNFPEGVFLLSGTGIIPPGKFSLQEGDIVRIKMEGIGELVNPVKIV